MHGAALRIGAVLATWAATTVARAPECTLTGRWTYAPEPGHEYNWVEGAQGQIACFAGRDGWREARGHVVGSNVTISFGDASCPGAGPLKATKWGTVDATCSEVVMHDTQPNCPKQGLCKYVRCMNNHCPGDPPPPSPPCKSTAASVDVGWLACRAKQIIVGCQEPIQSTSPLNKGINATSAYTPDARHSYGAQWTRDFQYTVSGAWDLMDEASVKASVRYTFAGQRADGCMPDRVQIDGMSVMAPGGMLPGNKRNPTHDHAWDNGPFAALLLTSTSIAWPDKEFFCSLEPLARKALDFVNRSKTATNHLVYNDPIHPNCTYGFTDTVAKTGNLLFCSLLYVDASQQLARLSAKYSCGDSSLYATEAARIGGEIDATMKDPGGGPLWLAATIDNAYPDVWGSAYLVALNLSSPARRHAAMAEMVTHKETYFRNGQVRSLPFPQLWTRCNFSPGGQGGCPANGTYQNGAYWATPLSYITAAMLQTGHADFAEELLTEAVADFKAGGIYEDVDYGYPAHAKGVLNYTASATSALLAARLLHAHRAGEDIGSWPHAFDSAHRD